MIEIDRAQAGSLRMNGLQSDPPLLRWAGSVVLVLALVTLSGCGGGDPAAAYRAGDYKTSLAVYSARAETGDLDALNVVGIHYYLGLGADRDYARAVAAFEQAALGANSQAQRNLGIMYLHGYGVPQDNHRAYGWFFKAYDSGNPHARSYIKFLSDNVTPNAGQKARAQVDELIRAHMREARQAAHAKAAP